MAVVKTRTSGKQVFSQETRDEAMKIARGTQRPGQTKEQTRLIAQGIQKGIDQYKSSRKPRPVNLINSVRKVRLVSRMQLTFKRSKRW